MSKDHLSALFSDVSSIFWVIFFFAGSIFVHELGHFLAARRRGLKVTRFSIGIGPRLFSWHKGGVEYCVSLLPIGGYVLIPELSDLGITEGKGPVERPVSYLSKIIVLVMGGVFNILFAFLLATLLWIWGQPTYRQTQTNRVGYVARELSISTNETIPGPAFLAGLQPGDTILAVDGVSLDHFSQINQAIMLGEGRGAQGEPQVTLSYLRENKVQDVKVYPALVQVNEATGDRVRMIGLAPEHSLIVNHVAPNSPAQEAGLMKEDRLTHLNGQPLHHISQLASILEENFEQKNDFELRFVRDDQPQVVRIEARKRPISKQLAQLEWEDASGNKSKLQFFQASELELNRLSSMRAHMELSSQSHYWVLSSIEQANASKAMAPKEGDFLIKVGNQRIETREDLERSFQKGEEIKGLWFRTQDSMTALTPDSKPLLSWTDQDYKVMLGVSLVDEKELLHVDPFSQMANQFHSLWGTLKGLISPRSDIKMSHMSGPPGVIRVLHEFSSLDLRLLLNFVIFMNINWGILNLLPIPVLDGGHILYATIAHIRRRPLPFKFIAWTQTAFILLLLGTMLYVSSLDIQRWQGDQEAQRKYELNALRQIPVSFKSK